MRKFVRRIFILVLFCILSFSIYNLYIIFHEYKKNKDVYKDVRKIVLKEDEKSNKDVSVENSNNIILGSKEYTDLKARNEDFLLWIYIPGTNIDYPVVQGNNNEYYLTHDFNKNYLPSGSIFMDYRNNFEEDNIIIVYGHHMRNKTMFGELEKFKNEKFFNGNNLIRVEYKNTTYIYEVFSVYVADLNNKDYLKVDFKDKKDKEDYLNYIKDRSLYNKDLVLTSDDNIITLYTCSYEFENARTIVHAKLISSK